MFLWTQKLLADVAEWYSSYESDSTAMLLDAERVGSSDDNGGLRESRRRDDVISSGSGES